MNKKLQVFVSSTYLDMLSERQATVEAILRAGHIPAGMELFAAGDESQWDTIRTWIDDSDIFMLILGGRYGSLEPKSGKSYVELEYEYASKKKKPFFAAVISERHLVAKVKSFGPDAIERTNGQLLQSLREKVTRKVCRFFDDLNELKLIVFESLSKLERNDDLVGWVRGSDVIAPKPLLDEIDRLKTENASLSSKINELNALESSAPSLSEDAISLLLTAKNGHGGITATNAASGYLLMVGGKEFLKPSATHREQARWKSVIQELLLKHLIRKHSERGDIPSFSINDYFELTKRGYDIGDEIEKSRASKPA